MRKRRFSVGDMKRQQLAMLAWQQDSSLLELLCEDGFLEPSELQDEDSSVAQLVLLRRAISRGFLLASSNNDAAQDMLTAKKLDVLRAWTDLVDEDVHLRAPPCCA